MWRHHALGRAAQRFPQPSHAVPATCWPPVPSCSFPCSAAVFVLCTIQSCSHCIHHLFDKSFIHFFYYYYFFNIPGPQKYFLAHPRVHLNTEEVFIFIQPCQNTFALDLGLLNADGVLYETQAPYHSLSSALCDPLNKQSSKFQTAGLQHRRFPRCWVSTMEHELTGIPPSILTGVC